jgi:hypothetical protein
MLGHNAILLLSHLTAFVTLTAVMLQNISVFSSTVGPYSVSFSFRMLNETSTETAHFIKDINAKDILGEHSAEL